MEKIKEVEVLVMFGEKYVNGKKTGEHGFFKVRDIYKIVSFSPKPNYHVPLFYTKYGVFSAPLTIEACKEILEPHGILLLDSSNLVNVNNIVDIDDRFQRVSVLFENGVEGVIARGNKKLLEDLIKKRDEDRN